MNRRLVSVFLCCFCFFSPFVAAEDTPAYEELIVEKNPDPWEKSNRRIYKMNMAVDRWFFKPVAKGYHVVTPDFVETGVSNFFSNIGEVVTVANDLGQLKFKKAGKDTGRFLVNTTVGLAGVFDVAQHWGMPQVKEDFGQTLGYWGVRQGPYLMLPLLGPSSIRDSGGLVIDSITTGPVFNIEHVPTRNSMFALRAVNVRSELLESEKILEGQSDAYSFLREAYLQSRELQVNDGVWDASADDFGDEDF